jgi:hypothetical protein
MLDRLAVSDVKPRRGATAAEAIAPASTARQIASSCSRRGAMLTSATRPAKPANSAPRDTEMESPMPSGTAAAALAVRIHRARVTSPAMRQASTTPIAATSPIAFQ